MRNPGGDAQLAYVDANVILRSVLQDNPEQGKRATRFLSSTDAIVLSGVVLAEIVYILSKQYGCSRTKIAEVTRSLLARDNVLAFEHHLIAAVDLYETRNIDFVDAYLAALVASAPNAVVASFDQDFDKIPTITRLAP